MVEDNDNNFKSDSATDPKSDNAVNDNGGRISQTLVTARGTGDGLIVRMNTKKGFTALKAALEAFLMSRKSFLAGNQITLEWIGTALTEDEIEEINADFKRYEITVRKPSHSSGSDILALTGGDFTPEPSRSFRSDDEDAEYSGEGIGGALFGGVNKISTLNRKSDNYNPVDTFGMAERTPNLSDLTDVYSVKTSLRNNVTFHSNAESETGGAYERVSLKNLKTGDLTASGITDSSFWDEADTRAVFTTLRSGQKIETEHSVIIVGDINSGAEVIAGGDIFVLGALRGVAHAGAFDETGGGRVIMALDLQPTQLRIGTVISRGVGESTTVKAVSSAASKFNQIKSSASKLSAAGKPADYSCTPEVAYVDGTNIVVEPYNSRAASQRGAAMKGAANFR